MPDSPASAPTLDDAEAALLCDQARDLAEAGRLDRAAALYERVAQQAGPRRRAQAALGLAVVRELGGDTAAARRADEAAIATADAEFAPRAAYHLALLCEREGDPAGAADAWRAVLDLGGGRHAAAAHHGLARLYEASGDHETAHDHWRRALEASDDPVAVAEAARDRAERLLERGAADEAAEAVARGLAARETPALRALLGAVRVEQAIAEFDAAVAQDSGEDDPASVAVARELLARLLAVRGDAETAERVWHDGLGHRDGRVAALVRARLRRGFPEPDPEAVAQTGETGFWWDPYLEAAVASDSAPLLAGELFAALSRMYALLAVEAGGTGPAARPPAALAEALRVPDDYVWGAALREDVRARLRGTAPGAE
ncbi:MAG TPA: tetratricopeptide repeat protein [Thermobifida alba]|nr:tetratricopeptide repeat protein [Thermobifida alba]